MADLPGPREQEILQLFFAVACARKKMDAPVVRRQRGFSRGRSN
jgi:hypothetical protein